MQVRYRLRDNGEPQTEGYIPLSNINNKPEKGQYWSDRLILLMLDTAQNILLNQALAVKDEVLLNGLFSESSFTANATLPNDFAWYIGGVAYPPNGFNERISRIYVGGEAEQYRNVRHYAVYLIGNSISSRWLATYPSNGRLTYWRRPTPINQLGLNLTDFEDEIYNDWIVVQACVLLGMAETQTQREYKNLQVVKQKFMINPKKFVNYIENREQVGQDYGQKNREQSNADDRQNGGGS